MSFNSPLAGVIPMSRAIDHYFELALYLLVCTGFGTLASTSGLDLPSIILVAVALAIRGYLLAKRRPFAISERWTTPLSLAYFVFFAADYFVFSRAFLPATVHLALFGVVVRMFSLRRERDHVTLAILAFLMVLAAAVLTVDSIFLFAFAAFMMMAVGTFVLMEMRRSGHAANIQASHSNDLHEHRRLAFSLARVAPALMLMILISGAAVFFIMPRMSAGYMGGYSFGSDLSSGFSDRVQLGQIGQIQQSTAVVMHIQIDGDTVGRYDLHWRGVALSKFDGTAWSNPREQSILLRQPDSSFRIPGSNPPLRSYVTTSAAARTYDPLPRPDGADRDERFFPGAGPAAHRRLSDGGRRFPRGGLQLRHRACHQPLRGGIGYCGAGAGRVAHRGTELSSADRRRLICVCPPSIRGFPAWRLRSQLRPATISTKPPPSKIISGRASATLCSCRRPRRKIPSQIFSSSASKATASISPPPWR